MVAFISLYQNFFIFLKILIKIPSLCHDSFFQLTGSGGCVKKAKKEGSEPVINTLEG